MTNNDWIKQLQSMMEHYEEPVGNDLWQDIEARLPERQAPHRAMPAWRRYAAAAAVALIVIGTGYLLWPNGDNSTTEKPTTAMVQDKIEPQPATESLAQNDDTSPDVAIPTVTPRAAKAVTSKKMPNAINSTGEQIVQAISTPTEIKEVQEINEKKPNSQPKEQSNQPAIGQAIEHNETHVNPRAGHIVKPSRQQFPITLDLYASNGLKGDNLSNKDYAYANDAINYYLSTSREDLIYLPEDIYTAKHHAPYSLGVSVRLPLNKRLSLTSGMVYTRLKSDFTSARNKREQTLHYVGVPIGVNYNLWNYKRFNVYAIGGVQADFNVKATMKQEDQTNKMNKDRVQISGLIGPGLQLDVTKDFGIYVEPTVRYYFDNNSNVSNYFKDKPWNINLNSGLRLTLK